MINNIENTVVLNTLIAPSKKLMKRARIRKTDQENLDRLWIESPSGGEKVSIPASELMSYTSGALNVIKSDLEGMDFEVIYSLRDEIKKSKPVVCAEFLIQSEEAKRFYELMAGMDYEIFQNIAPRNSRMFGFQPFRIDQTTQVIEKGIYDLIAAPIGSERTALWHEMSVKSSRLRVDEAFVSFADGDYGNTIRILKSSQCEKDQQAIFLMAHCCLLEKKFDDAAAAIKLAIDRYGATNEAYIVLARASLNLDRYAEAEASARAAANLTPTDHLAYFLLARACWQMNDKNGAEKAIEEAMRLAPENEAYSKLSSSIRRTDNVGENS
ncbi:MAG: hypothetical protein AAGB11_03515 [Pseudomonadota bacterium]